MSQHRVLLADPDEMLLARYRVHLAKEGFTVGTANTGFECMDRLLDMAPDVLVLDPELMAEFGEDALAALANGDDGPAINVIVLTDPDCDLRFKFSAVQVGAWLMKPLSPTTLTHQIRRLLHLPAVSERFVTEWA